MINQTSQDEIIRHIDVVESPFVHEWHNQTTLHMLAVVAFFALGSLTLVVPRRYALIPLFVMACFIAPAQRFVFLTLDFNLLRLMVMIGWLRVLIRGEFRPLRWSAIDWMLVIWTCAGTLAFVAQRGSLPALIYRLGMMYDAVGLYFLIRILVRDFADARSLITGIIFISLPVAAAFVVERSTGRNMFSIFGGVSEITQIRAGRLRCQGAFAHPILAGSFWVALLPLIAAMLWHRSIVRLLSLLAILACFIIVIACASSTPLAAMYLSALALITFPFRRWFRWIRIGLALLALQLHLYMNNPIWHLLTRIDIVTGATGWYRFKLIDEFIRHFGDWWLVGTSTYASWWRWGLEDVTNQFVLEGVNGGLLTLSLFIALIVIAFRSVGKILRSVADDRSKTVLAWALGTSLFVHVLVFVAVTYFGQTILVWYLTLGLIGSLRECVLPCVAVESPVPILQRRRLNRKGWLHGIPEGATLGREVPA